MKKEAAIADKELKPSTTAKNTTFLDAFLAVLKLGSGLISGSIGLIADGTDATMDTVEAILVWLGIKYHRENLSTFLVIFGLFIAAVSVLFDSVTHLLATLAGNAANSLTLISQSVDSKNHIFIGVSVIIGAIFTLYGIYFVDTIIGIIVGANIFKDAVGLLREAISAQKGEEADYSQEYKLPLQACWEENQLMAFRNWILYTLWANESKTKADIIESLQRVFHPDNYIPVLSELNATFSEHYDFDGQFKDLIHPLKKNKFLIEEIDEEYSLTEDGEKHLKKFITHFKYYDVHESDAILLAMSQKKNK